MTAGEQSYSHTQRGGAIRCNVAISLAIEGDSRTCYKLWTINVNYYCEGTMNTSAIFTVAFGLCRIRFPVVPSDHLGQSLPWDHLPAAFLEVPHIPPSWSLYIVYALWVTPWTSAILKATHNFSCAHISPYGGNRTTLCLCSWEVESN